MTGTYTEITGIWTDKASYRSGETVWVSVLIKNLHTASIHIHCVAEQDGQRFIDLNAWVSPGLTYSFGGYFIMPGQEVTIHACSYRYGDDGMWHFDDEMTKNVSLGELAPEVTQFEIVDYLKV